MPRMTTLRAAWLALVTAACGHPATPAPAGPAPARTTIAAPAADAGPVPPVPLERDLPTLASRATRLYQDVASAFTATSDDCAVATAQLGALRTTYADVVAASAQVVRDGRSAELRAALEPHARVLDAAAKTIMGSPTMTRCSTDPAFTTAFDALVGAPP